MDDSTEIEAADSEGDIAIVKHKHKHHHEYKSEETQMNEPVNVFAGQSPFVGGYPIMGGFGGNNDGFGMGGGLIGGLVLGSLLRNGGFGGFGNGVVGDVGATRAIDTNSILEGIGDIKAAVPLAEAQVQLALAGAQSDITSQTLQQTLALQNQGFSSQLATQAGFANTGDKIDNLQASLSLAIATNQFNCVQATMADGDKTRSLINSIDRDNLNRLITTQANEIVELRGERNRDSDRHGIEISMINNQNQNQMQFQQQAQILGSLCGAMGEVGQLARATNQTIQVGNSGLTTSGAQTANPTNVKA